MRSPDDDLKLAINLCLSAILQSQQCAMTKLTEEEREECARRVLEGLSEFALFVRINRQNMRAELALVDPGARAFTGALIAFDSSLHTAAAPTQAQVVDRGKLN